MQGTGGEAPQVVVNGAKSNKFIIQVLLELPRGATGAGSTWLGSCRIGDSFGTMDEIVLDRSVLQTQTHRHMHA